jgi:hypothetical protein
LPVAGAVVACATADPLSDARIKQIDEFRHFADCALGVCRPRGNQWLTI